MNRRIDNLELLNTDSLLGARHGRGSGVDRNPPTRPRPDHVVKDLDRTDQPVAPVPI